ncbi:MAG TPA: NifU family protein [Fimbriiglobus sp.]|jgi:Fe-S cluster biogenesis protein NfuA
MTNPLIERIESSLRIEVAPALGLDGSEIEVVGFENGIASVRLGAVCGGCPATILSVITQMEQELRRHVPEVEILEPVP